MDRGPDPLWKVVTAIENRIAIGLMAIVTLVGITTCQFFALVIIHTQPRAVYVIPGAREPGFLNPEEGP